MLAHAVKKPIELRLLGKPFGIELRHHRERPVEEAQASVRIELSRAGGHPIRQLALQFHVPRKFGPGVFQVLNIDSETGDCTRRKRHVDDAQHAPLPAQDRRLHQRNDPPRFLGPARGRGGAVFAFLVDQLEAALNDFLGVRPLDCMDEGAVDQAELQIGTPIPHRKWRGFDQVR